MFKRALHLTALLLASFAGAAAQTQPPTPSAVITYTNARYGFRFLLPATWKGFTILTGPTWGGALLTPAGTEVVRQVRGPGLVLRNPHWTSADPHEDIPIFIFTQAQWALVEQDRLAIGAAPIPPSELGRNAKYVFALPARYNFDYATGWQEVEKIIGTHPLHPF